MKTPLTELIEVVRKRRDFIEDDGYKEAMQDVFLIALNLINSEKEQIINFHIEVMKQGLIDEGDKKWSDAYLPKIRKTAEQYYQQTFKSDE